MSDGVETRCQHGKTTPLVTCIQCFAQMVWEMRAAQRRYFRTRQKSMLNESKDWERRVDQVIAEIDGQKQCGLFG